MPNQQNDSGLGALIPMLLQVEQYKLNERNTAIQEEQVQQLMRTQTANIMDQFTKSLEGIRDPSQLDAEINMYSGQFGIPKDALLSRAANYLPSIASQRAGATQRGVTALQGTPSGNALDQTAAVSSLTGQGEGDVAQGQVDAAGLRDPNITTQQVRQASVFRRTGYDPMKFNISQLIANSAPMLNSAASIEAGTGINATNKAQLSQGLMGMQLNRDNMQQQGELGRTQNNLTARGQSLSYAVSMAPYMAAKMKAGQGASGLTTAERMEAAKMFRDLQQMQSQGGVTGITKDALDNGIRIYGEAAGLLPSGTTATFAPNIFEHFYRKP